MILPECTTPAANKHDDPSNLDVLVLTHRVYNLSTPTFNSFQTMRGAKTMIRTVSYMFLSVRFKSVSYMFLTVSCMFLTVSYMF